MNNTLHKKKYGKTLLSIFFAIVCILYVLPVVMVASVLLALVAGAFAFKLANRKRQQ